MGNWESSHALTVEWYTPRSIIEALGPFDLDPASPGDKVWPTANKHFTKEDDGLMQPWAGYVFLNPPYGQLTGRFMRRMAEHNNGIALIFARVETAWFQDYVWDKAKSLLFPRGRIQFHRPDGTTGASTAPSVLVAYGEYGSYRLATSGIVGKFIRE